MKFGKLEDIGQVDFRLPDDHPETASVLRGEPFPARIRLAGTMWNVPEWKGRWIRQGTRPADMLREYGRLFAAIELNATHYRTPSSSQVRVWCEQVPGDFLFCPKFPQVISHYRRFRNCGEPTDAFLRALEAFGDRLGPAFIQLPEHLGTEGAPDLVSYLDQLPRDIHLAVEFRHPEWFTESGPAEGVWQFLHRRGITAILSDTAGRRDALHMRLTSPHAIVRFGGYAPDPSDSKRLADWCHRLLRWSEQGLQTFHLWMHQAGSLETPLACAEFAACWKALTGKSLAAPEPSRPSLFD